MAIWGGEEILTTPRPTLRSFRGDDLAHYAALNADPPEETEAFRGWLVTTAQAAADAAKEGGFMGFGAVQVSKAEQEMLDQLRGALGQG
jgi:hypothetical protein